MSKNVLVVATHPDDETLACGGTILRHKACGDRVNWLIMTGIHEEHGFSSNAISKRKDTLARVAGSYCFDAVVDLNLPTARLDTIPQQELVTRAAKAFNDIRPEVVYLPFCHDVHTDHQTTFKAVFACTKSFRYPFIQRLLMMETVSETDFAPAVSGAWFTPNVYMDITDHLERKLEIMRLYDTEIADHPFPWNLENIRALATHRGAMSGCHQAEAFMLLKEIL